MFLCKVFFVSKYEFFQRLKKIGKSIHIYLQHHYYNKILYWKSLGAHSDVRPIKQWSKFIWPWLESQLLRFNSKCLTKYFKVLLLLSILLKNIYCFTKLWEFLGLLEYKNYVFLEYNLCVKSCVPPDKRSYEYCSVGSCLAFINLYVSVNEQ